MSVECYPITVLPHVSQIYRDFLTMGEKPADAAVRQWYGSEPFAGKWMLDSRFADERETIQRSAEAEGRYERPKNYGYAKVRIAPKRTGEGIEFVDESEGTIPKKYVRAIADGVRKAIKAGVIAGHEMIDLRVELTHGSDHPDGNELSYAIAGAIAFREAARKAHPKVVKMQLVDPARLADELKRQNESFGAGPAAMANIEKLRAGAKAVVTGQQVVLFGGPLLTLLKAASAVARAKEATRATGVEHVPVFWLATEDHDLAEVDQVSLLTKTAVETLHAGPHVAHAVPVGGVVPGAGIEPVLERASELLGYAPVTDWLRECYQPREGHKPTLASAFARLMAKIFAEQGLIIIDAASRECHSLGAKTLRYAIEHADELQQALITRSEDLVHEGYHAQVMVAEGASLLFLVDEETGERVALRRPAEGQWRAGGHIYSSEDLLAILDKTPERLSPNALLRPVFQDTLLPTAAYVGGPAEIAYFAQSAVLYDKILGHITSVLPRLSATLIEPAIATIMDKDEIQLPDAMTTADDLAQRFGARAMPIALKRKLAAVGNALDTELEALTEYLRGIDQTLGTSAESSGSKMLYQMNRLRRMAATYELQKESSLRKHAEAITLNLYPDGHPQERVLAGVWFLARYGEGLIERLVGVAGNQCPGHVVVRL